jgi:hypothetical protein
MWCTIAVAALGALAACTGGGPAASSTAPTDSAHIWADFVACARAHGHPEWPDATVDPATGEATFSGFNAKALFDAVREPCARVLDGLPPQANPMARPVVSASEIALKLRYSRCMREHGVPEWRDPGADGYYDGAGIAGYNTDPDVTARMNAAREICDPIIGR